MSADLVHKHIILRIEANKPQLEDELKEWMVELVDKIGMKILAGPISANIDYMPGNNGPTCVVIIETSHFACHVWNDVDPALIQLDVYTCSELDPQTVFDALDKWDPIKIDYKYLDRETNLSLVS